MLNAMLVIAGIFIALIAGYWMGFRACFDYLMEEVKEHKNEHDISHDLGPDYGTK